ncbi:neisseria PilC protein [mine drainage metagenome]|uniref:Neisseria PilC protein n=1 Tax=mine drainage metagenome TaxID=410659 RepID=A0A1J5Q166_9ZZZZ
MGSLGAGGKGYFVLDVTDPANFTAANAANLVIKDTTDALTGTKDADIGVITAPPVVDDAIASKSRQIVQMNNGRWAVVLGNGANSNNEAPVLLIQYLDGDKSIKKVSPCAAPIASTACAFKGGNGLSAPQLIDLNGDGKVDVAYAGDLQGNLWKFNLTSATDSSWGMSFSGQPFFVAKGRATSATRPSATVAQPITSAPYYMQHPLGGIMVSFGTGRNLTDADQTSTGIDSYYALWDNSTFSTSTGSVTLTDSSAINTTSATVLPTTTGGLVQQTITGTVTDAGTTLYTSSTNPVDYSTKRGWYIDLSLSSGERVLLNTRLFAGQTILMTSTVPKSGASSSAESCTASATSEMNFMYLLNMFTGKPPVTPPFVLTTTPATPPNIITVGGGDTAIVENPVLGKKYVVKSDCPAGSPCGSKQLTVGLAAGRRASWRQK